MKKKILVVGIILILGVMLVILTGCGKNEDKAKINNEYEKYIETIRNAQASDYMGKYTLGELYDNALKDSSWDRYTKELAGGTKKILISVKGTNKFEENEVTEVVYEINTETLEYKFYNMLVNNEKGGNLMSLMKKSADDLDEQKNK